MGRRRPPPQALLGAVGLCRIRKDAFALKGCPFAGPLYQLMLQQLLAAYFIQARAVDVLVPSFARNTALSKELEIPAFRNIGIAMREKELLSVAVKRFLEYLEQRKRR